MAAASRSVKAHTAGPRAHRMSPRPAQIHRIPGPLCVLLGPRMWIVRLALRRPYTFVVVALLIVVLGLVSMWRMPTDIFPDVDIPVASVVWSFTGISPEDMERRVLLVSERAFTGSVNDIEHIESQAMVGVGLTRIYFQPGAKIEAAIAQLGSTSQSILRALPPGMSAPLIIRYSASSVPILQLSVASETLPEAVLFDYAQNFVRTQLATVRGASVSLPYGGKPRQIMVDLDPRALKATGLAPSDVVNAINAQNLILPTGTAKIGAREYSVRLNSSPDSVEALNNLPIKQINGAIVYIRDVAQVRDGYAVQTNIVRQGGRRASLVTIFKSGGASTLDVVQRIKDMLPKVQATLPPELDLKLMFDQSIFVRAAVDGVVREAVIAAGLTALMILIFLGSWRSTLIVTRLHPAVDPLLGHRAGPARPDHQHHDPGRPRARGGHPGRRRHRRDREHPPQPGAWASRSSGRSWTARSRSRCPPSSRRSASASCSCRWSSSRARRASSSPRSPSRWSSP